MNGHQLTREQRDQLRALVDHATRDKLDTLAAAGHLASKKPGRHHPWRTPSKPLKSRTRHDYTSS